MSMAKRRKQKRIRHSPRRPSRKVVAALSEVDRLFRDGEYDEAKTQLLSLARRYPRSKPVLLALYETSLELEDWPSVARYGERLLPLERGTDRAATLNNLVYAHMKLRYPALALEAARELINQHPDFPAIEEIKLLAQSTEEFMSKASVELPGAADFAPSEAFDIMVQHDRIRFYTESGQAEEAISAAETLLERAPGLTPARNNLSMSHFLAGNTKQAIAIAEQVLAQEPDNYHALANLTRFSFLTAQFEAARKYAERLKTISSDDADLEVKQAEALSFLGDDVGVRDTYQRAQERHGELPPLLLHLAAVAHHRLGDEKSAWRLWGEAVEQEPSLELAQNNLEDQQLPAGDGEAPWYWSFPYWFSVDLRDEIDKRMESSMRRRSNRAVATAMSGLANDYPYLADLFPHILERGDRHAREFVINFIRIVDTPGLVDTLQEFAMGRYGSDNIRMEAMQFISQEHPDRLPEDKMVPLWLQGQQTEIFLLGFAIYEEPDPPADVASEVMDKHEEAYDLLMDDKPEEAERLLKEIIAAAPDFSSAYNQLALAYDMQGRRDESRAVVEETHTRFPDYLFSRVGLARMYVLENRIQEAKDLVAPLLRRDRLHISEFRALAQTEMEIALAEERKESARAWLSMWRQVEEDHPDLMRWQLRIEGQDGMMRKLSKLLG